MPRAPSWHRERHRIMRHGWLRAAVLGANDGLVSTASLIVGVAAAAPDKSAVLLAGAAGLVAGAMSMAAGEYVSVSSQADAEKAELAVERRELREDAEGELNELAGIYEQRGVESGLAQKVARQLMAKDALGAHARDELGITEASRPRPIQAGMASALAFSVGAIAPLIAAGAAAPAAMGWTAAASTLIFLAGLGALGAKLGEAPMLRAVLRVTFWGAVAMAATAGIGRLVGVAV
ncbi:MAG: VIT family protein [Hyphomonadaceae bacterium]